ncbi:hypothetical protein J6590_008435 [Homalodisca vitripennis]|nr:hypothetical protein J6590_008435 [Homalodisca vitripennis]
MGDVRRPLKDSPSPLQQMSLPEAMWRGPVMTKQISLFCIPFHHAALSLFTHCLPQQQDGFSHSDSSEC